MSKTSIKQYDLGLQEIQGLEMFEFQNRPVPDHDIIQPHRDSHYLLLVLKSGGYTMKVDFQPMVADEVSILLIIPGQIHQVIEINDPHGFAVSFEPTLISTELHNNLTGSFNQPFLIKEAPELLGRILTICQLLYDLYKENKSQNHRQSVIELLQVMLRLILSFPSITPITPAAGRAMSVLRQFRVLLEKEYKAWKKPSFYASALSLSVSHLNDTLNAVTGQTLSGQIQDRSILEAKRLLYFTDMTIKEISYEIGYDDPAYFSRLFRKATQQSPNIFRSIARG